MADRLKDDEDRALEALFASQPIADDGFTRRVVARVRRRLWFRRLLLPAAVLAGAAIAAEPAMAMFGALGDILAMLPMESVGIPRVPGLQDVSAWLVVSGAAIAAMLLLPVLDD